MPKYKITIEYDGTNFSGWQIQPEKRTIQNEIEKALTQIYKNEIKITGAGRTDAGVHAKGQVATFSFNDSIPIEKIPRAINSNLPEEIVITNCEIVPDDFHPRFNAKWKIYQYRILTDYTRSALSRNFRHHFRNKIDLNLLNDAKNIIEGTHDFKAFACLRGTETGSEDYCRILESITITKSNSEIDITFKGNGFLYKMVRMLAGSMLQVASGKLPKEELIKLLKNGCIASGGPALPSNGLILLEVMY